MAANKKRHSALLTMQRGFAALVAADHKVLECAAICRACHRAGKPMWVKDAEDKGEDWLRTMLGLETNVGSVLFGERSSDL